MVRFIGKFEVKETKFWREAKCELRFGGNSIPLAIVVNQSLDAVPTVQCKDWPFAGVFVGDLDKVMKQMRAAQAIAEDWKNQNWSDEKESWDYAIA